MKKKSTLLKEKRQALHKLQEEYHISLFFLKSELMHQEQLKKKMQKIAQEMRDLK